MAALDEFVDETLEVVAAAAARASSWPEAAYLGVKAGIEHFVVHPGLTRMAFEDLFEVGPAVNDSIGTSLGKLAGMLRESSPEAAPCAAART